MGSSNGRAPRWASQMRPNELSLRPGEPAQAVCGDCGTWQLLRHACVAGHGDGAGSKCPGSRQKIKLDVSKPEWLMLYADAVAETGRIRRPDGKPASHNPFETYTRVPERSSPSGQPSVRAGLAPDRRGGVTRSSSPAW